MKTSSTVSTSKEPYVGRTSSSFSLLFSTKSNSWKQHSVLFVWTSHMSVSVHLCPLQRSYPSDSHFLSLILRTALQVHAHLHWLLDYLLPCWIP